MEANLKIITWTLMIGLTWQRTSAKGFSKPLQGEPVTLKHGSRDANYNSAKEMDSEGRYDLSEPLLYYHDEDSRRAIQHFLRFHSYQGRPTLGMATRTRDAPTPADQPDPSPPRGAAVDPPSVSPGHAAPSSPGPTSEPSLGDDPSDPGSQTSYSLSYPSSLTSEANQTEDETDETEEEGSLGIDTSFNSSSSALTSNYNADDDDDDDANSGTSSVIYVRTSPPNSQWTDSEEPSEDNPEDSDQQPRDEPRPTERAAAWFTRPLAPRNRPRRVAVVRPYCKDGRPLQDNPRIPPGHHIYMEGLRTSPSHH